MISLLTNIIEIITNIPAYILYAGESLVNLFFSAVEGLFLVDSALLGNLPTPEAPPFIGEINWFFPIGLVIGIAAPLVASFTTWLAVKWIFKKIGDV